MTDGDIDPRDLRVDTHRSGPWTRVKITHLPSGVWAEGCSQREAMEELRLRRVAWSPTATDDQVWYYLLGHLRMVAWTDGRENLSVTLYGREAKAILDRLGDTGPTPSTNTTPDDLEELRRRAGP